MWAPRPTRGGRAGLARMDPPTHMHCSSGCIHNEVCYHYSVLTDVHSFGFVIGVCPVAVSSFSCEEARGARWKATMHTIQPKVSAGWIVRYVLGLAGQPSSVGVDRAALEGRSLVRCTSLTGGPGLSGGRHHTSHPSRLPTSSSEEPSWWSSQA